MRFNKSTMLSLGYYVYALVDPKDNSVFYIGKGKNNRIYDHIKQAKNHKPDPNCSQKLNKINEILSRNPKEDVKMYILHYGLTEEHALLIESVLIDVFNHNLKFNLGASGLTNVNRGIDCCHGISSVEDIKILLSPKKQAKINYGEKILAININIMSTNNQAIYNKVRSSWVLDPNRANKADYIVAVHSGLIIGVYKLAGGWKKIANLPNRYEFDKDNTPIDKNVINRLLHKYLPMKSKGAQNPIWYVNNWK